MSETDIVNDIKLQLFGEFPEARLFRNNNGVLQDIYGNYITYGLGPGTADLVGFIPRACPLCGSRLAQFVAIEVKKPRARTQKKRLEQQTDFLALVNASGGCAGFATCFAEARNILNHIK